ncbi:hypothetical protein Gbfr_018_070 [Gluconobacter frateurii M-2]|nr:hypothetical protein Gbfr_018_070 [Gluconobacter frateurii M-2]
MADRRLCQLPIVDYMIFSCPDAPPPVPPPRPAMRTKVHIAPAMPTAPHVQENLRQVIGYMVIMQWKLH